MAVAAHRGLDLGAHNNFISTVANDHRLNEAELMAAAAYWSRTIQEALAQGMMTPVIELARAYGIAERFARVQRPPVWRLKSQVKATSPSARAAVEARTRVPLSSEANPIVQDDAPRPTGNLVPSYLRADAQPSAAAQPVEPNATQAAIPMLSVSLPLGGSLSREALEEMLSKPASGPAPADGPTQEAGTPTETTLPPQLTLVAATTGTFRDQLAAVLVPVMSLEDYAELRARLTVFGETHEPTLKRLGVVATEAREALRAQFAEQFQRDAAAQERFLAAMQTAMGRARAEREGSVGD